MKKSLIETISQISEDDIILLSHLYLYRAIDVEQACQYIYHIDTSIPSGKSKRTKIKKRLIDLGLVTISIYNKDKEALQITNKGIDVVRYSREIPKEIIDIDTKVVKRGYYTAADLALNTRLINHQVHLNQIMFDFGEIARKMSLPWNYYDEKFLSQYKGIRPDGMITILDHDIFLEVDMATESKAQLKEKWDHYRAFIASSEFSYKSRKITVIFDVDNIISKNKIKNRIELVRQTIVESLLDVIGNDFDIVIKHQSEVVSYIFESLVPSILNRHQEKNDFLHFLENDGWNISHGYKLNSALFGDYPDFFIRKLDKNNKVKKISGTIQEYFIDFYLDRELQVLHRIENYKKNNSQFKRKFNRDSRLIIVTQDIESLYYDLKLLGDKALGQFNIFVIDLNNFNINNELYKNLFLLGNHGEVYKVLTRDHSRREFKYQIGAKMINNKRGKIVDVKSKSKVRTN